MKCKTGLLYGPLLNNMYYCAPLEISFHLVNKTTNEILPDGYGTDSAGMESNDLHNLHLQAHIKNSSSETIYQYNQDCKSGFTLLDQNLIPFNENIEVSCTQNQSLQIYKPYEEKYLILSMICLLKIKHGLSTVELFSA